MGQLRGKINGLFKKNTFKIDLSSFDWMKPFASYSVWMKIEYHYFAAENSKLGYRFYFAVPHRAVLKADIVKICDPGGLKAKLDAGQKLKEHELAIAGGGSANSRALRRAYLRRQIEHLSRWLRLKSEWIDRDALREKQSKYYKEIEELED